MNKALKSPTAHWQRENLELQRNLAAWQALAIPSATTDTPPDFLVGHDFKAFAELDRHPHSLATVMVPAPLPPTACFYIATLRYEDFAGSEVNQSQPVEASHHTEGPLHRYIVKPLYTDDAKGLEGKLLGFLPCINGRENLIESILTTVEMATTRLGPVSGFRLCASKGWLPPPQKLAPHIDSMVRKRLFMALEGCGSLQVSPTLLHIAVKSSQRPAFPDDSPPEEQPFSYISFATRELPTQTLSLWHGGLRQEYDEKLPLALPHSEPPHCGGLRLTMAMDFV